MGNINKMILPGTLNLKGTISLTKNQIEFLNWCHDHPNISDLHRDMLCLITLFGWYMENDKQQLNEVRSIYLKSWITYKKSLKNKPTGKPIIMGTSSGIHPGFYDNMWNRNP